LSGARGNSGIILAQCLHGLSRELPGKGVLTARHFAESAQRAVKHLYDSLLSHVEATMWWGIFVLTLSNTRGWAGTFSPLIITWLLVKVSGIPMLEKKYQNNPQYQAYKRITSAFIPGNLKRTKVWLLQC